MQTQHVNGVRSSTRTRTPSTGVPIAIRLSPRENKRMIARALWDKHARRDLLLLDMGYADYQRYLQGALWRSIRRRVWERDQGVCRRRRCDAPAVAVHHRAYTAAVLIGEDLSKLVSMCSACHWRTDKREHGRSSFVDQEQLAAERRKIGRWRSARV